MQLAYYREKTSADLPETIFEDDFGNGSGWGSSTAEAYNQLPSTTWDVTFNHGASANGGVYQHSNLIEFWRVSNASVSNAITLSRNFIAEPDTLYELEISLEKFEKILIVKGFFET